MSVATCGVALRTPPAVNITSCCSNDSKRSYRCCHLPTHSVQSNSHELVRVHILLVVRNNHGLSIGPVSFRNRVIFSSGIRVEIEESGVPTTSRHKLQEQSFWFDHRTLIRVKEGRGNGWLTFGHVTWLSRWRRKGFLNARPYASAVYAVDVCPSVCPSVRHKSEYYQNGRTNRAGFGIGTFFDLSYN